MVCCHLKPTKQNHVILFHICVLTHMLMRMYISTPLCELKGHTTRCEPSSPPGKAVGLCLSEEGFDLYLHLNFLQCE